MIDFEAVKSTPDISFIEDASVEEIRDEMIADYEKYISEAEKKQIKLERSSPHRMEIYAAAAQIYQAMQYIDRAGKLNLLKYSYGDYLDNLALLKGTRRLQASAAVTTLKYTASAKRSSATGIPAGSRVSGSDNVYFRTTEYAEIPAGELSVEVPAECIEAGTIGNGYKVGALNTMVDPIPYISSVENITETAGGADTESDEAFAERTHLAPSSYSTAGPEAAYEYWVRTYNASIGDVRITSDQAAGRVDIYFLMSDGGDPSEEIVNGLLDYLRNGDMRPMDDLVTAQKPEETTYSIDFTYYINRSDSSRAEAIQKAVEDAVKAYIAWQRKIGRDINPDELTAAVKKAGAKRLEIRSPVYTPIGGNCVAAVSEPTSVNYGGLEDD